VTIPEIFPTVALRIRSGYEPFVCSPETAAVLQERYGLKLWEPDEYDVMRAKVDREFMERCARLGRMISKGEAN